MGTTKDVRDAVGAELEFDPLVDDADIHAVSLSGDVALNGTVPGYPQYLEATAAAQRVAGVRNVHNHLQVVLPGEDYHDDAILTTAANNALALNVTVPDGAGGGRAGRQPDADRRGGVRPAARPWPERQPTESSWPLFGRPRPRLACSGSAERAGPGPG